MTEKNIKWDIPKRSFELKIYYGRKENDLKLNKNIQKLNIGNKITFDTSSSVSGGSNEANIVINGLTTPQMQELATSAGAWNDPIIYNKIEIYAGYDNINGLVFTGNIIEATPNLNSSNYSITLKALANFSEMVNTIKTFSFSGDVSCYNICQEIAKTLKFPVFKGEGVENIMVNNYYYANQSITSHLRYLSNITGLEVYIEKNSIVIKKTGQAIKNFKTFKINQSNLIGAISPTPQGFECDIKLNSMIRTGMTVKIQNYSFPRMNDLSYTLMSYSHHGDTRGGNWKTHIWCVIPEIYFKKYNNN